MKLLILADDFTGAMDTGVQLSRENISTLVFPQIPESFSIPDSCQVLVINTALRHCAPEHARKVIADLIHALYQPGLHIYIKTDSALRGCIGAYLEGASRTLRHSLHFIPAFPDAGRITRNSYVYVDGELLEHSVFSKDPRSPMKKSFIPDILCDTCTLPVIPVSSGKLPESFKEASKPPGTVAESLKTDFNASAVYLYDGETNDDLLKTGLFLKETGNLSLTAGCAGFAAQFPKLLDFEKGADFSPASHSPVLFLSGSANAVTFRQLQCAVRLGYPLISLSSWLELCFMQTPESAMAKEAENRLAAQASAFIADGISPILATAAGSDDLFDLEKATKQLGSEDAVHRVIQNCCSILVKRIIDSVPLDNLAIFGGDTVADILKVLDCGIVEAKGQLSTGVPLCLLEYQNRTLHLVTKSGGLGNESIVKIIEDYFYAKHN